MTADAAAAAGHVDMGRGWVEAGPPAAAAVIKPRDMDEAVAAVHLALADVLAVAERDKHRAVAGEAAHRYEVGRRDGWDELAEALVRALAPWPNALVEARRVIRRGPEMGPLRSRRAAEACAAEPAGEPAG